jgi:hypothetical protein
LAQTVTDRNQQASQGYHTDGQQAECGAAEHDQLSKA